MGSLGAKVGQRGRPGEENATRDSLSKVSVQQGCMSSGPRKEIALLGPIIEKIRIVLTPELLFVGSYCEYYKLDPRFTALFLRVPQAAESSSVLSHLRP